MRSFIFIAFLLALLGVSVTADTCLGVPGTVKIGKFCGGPTSCEYGSFCNNAGVCQASRKGGESCTSNNECDFGHDCQGPENLRVCVARASAGEPCDIDDETTNPSCGVGECINNICLTGSIGDKCTNTAACFGNTTCDVVCKPLADGDSCSQDRECNPLSFCEPVESICRPKKTSGICGSEEQCAYGYGCVGIASGDETQCVEYGSRKTGEYCGGLNQMCASGNCHFSGFCAKRGVNYCDRNRDCSYGEVCSCNNQPLWDGYGTCTPNGCQGSWEKFERCALENCRSNDVPRAMGDCRILNCEKQLLKYLDCSPASQIFLSVFSVALFAILSTFLGKNL